MPIDIPRMILPHRHPGNKKRDERTEFLERLPFHAYPYVFKPRATRRDPAESLVLRHNDMGNAFVNAEKVRITLIAPVMVVGRALTKIHT
jgi:hypothetical protein